MSLVVVADTSPINYLLETGYIEVLPSLYGQVILPTAVHGELSDRGSSDAVRQWASAPPGLDLGSNARRFSSTAARFTSRGDGRDCPGGGTARRIDPDGRCGGEYVTPWSAG